VACVVSARLAAWGFLAAGLGVLAVLYRCDPATTRGFPPCLFHSLTGLYCPGCGSGRALHRLLHGDVAAAFDLNPLMVLVLPFVLFGLGVYWVRAVTGRRVCDFAVPAVWIRALLCVVLVYWVLRNVPVAPFSYLAP